MTFTMEYAALEHLPKIMEIVREAAEETAEKGWFAAGDEAYFRQLLQQQGFVIMAREQESGEIAGFFAVVFPGEEEYMGQYTRIPKEDWGCIVHMDTVAVSRRYQGKGLHRSMLEACEKELELRRLDAGQERWYLLCSVHPDNCYSLENMRKSGYEILAEAKLYGGLERLILGKVLGQKRKDSKGFTEKTEKKEKI